MKYASKYYPFSFVRVASSPHPRTHTDARHLRRISVPVTPTEEVSGTRDTVSVDQPRRWRPRVTPGHFVWTRTRSRRPAERDGASRGHAEAGALARGTHAGQTLSDSGRERAAGRAPDSHHELDATTRDSNNTRNNLRTLKSYILNYV